MGNYNCSIDGKNAARAQIAAQVCTFHQFHHNEIVSIGLAIVVDLHYIRVL